MSIKLKGSDSILYDSVKGVLIDTAISLADDTWHKIKSFGVGSALPTALGEGGVFMTPKLTLDNITLVAGDEVWPLTQTEICKVDTDVSGTMGVIDTTDSCDHPYNTNIPDGYTDLSGTINTMMRFDESTEELLPVSKEFLNKFYTVVADDAAGVYTVKPKDDSDLLLHILLNREAVGVVGKKTNWLIIPVILSGISNNIALKDVDKADYTWSKGQGPASYYSRLET